MSIVARRSAVVGSCLALGFAARPGVAARKPGTVAGKPGTVAGRSIGQRSIDGWNTSTAETLLAAFTPDAIYEDVPFGVKKKGSAELVELHKYFHEVVGGLSVRLLASHVAHGHGTIEWVFGGKDVGIFNTGKPFEVHGVSVIEVRDDRISRNVDYYDVATIMKQVGVLPAAS